MKRTAFVTLRRGSVQEPIFDALKNAEGVQPDRTVLSPRGLKDLMLLYLEPGSDNVPAWADEVCSGAGSAYRNFGPFKLRAVSTACGLDLSLEVNSKTSIHALLSFETLLKALVEEGNGCTVIVDHLED